MNYKDILEYQTIFTQAVQDAKQKNKFEDCVFEVDLETLVEIVSQALPKLTPEKIRQIATEALEQSKNIA